MAGYRSRRDHLWQVALQLAEDEAKFTQIAQHDEEHGQIIQSKYNQLVSNMSCLGDIIAMMYQEKKLTLSEFEQIRHLQSTPIRANEELLSIIARKPRDVYECFLTVVKTTNQPHLYQMLVSGEDTCDEPNRDDASHHKDLICRNFTLLSEKLDSESELISLLYQQKVITVRERERVFCVNDTFQKNDLLLALLSKKSPKDFGTFLEALNQTGQGHLTRKLRGLSESTSDSTTDFSEDQGIQGLCKKPLTKVLLEPEKKPVTSISSSKSVTPPKTFPKPGQKVTPSRSLSKPIPPPKPNTKPTTVQHDSKLIRVVAKHTEKTAHIRTAERVILQSRLQGLDLCLMTDITIKVASVNLFHSDKVEDSSKMSFHILLQECHRLRKETIARKVEADMELDQLRDNVSKYSAAASLNEAYRTQLHSMQQELTSERLQSNKGRMHLEEKINKLKTNIHDETAKCKQLDEENLTNKTVIIEMEDRLTRAESDKSYFQKQIQELSVLVKSIDNKLQKSEDSFNESKSKIILLTAERDKVNEECETLIKRNEIMNDFEIQLHHAEENNKHLLGLLKKNEECLKMTEEETLELIRTQESTVEAKSLLNEQILKLQNELDIERHQRMALDHRYSVAIADQDHKTNKPECDGKYYDEIILLAAERDKLNEECEILKKENEIRNEFEIQLHHAEENNRNLLVRLEENDKRLEVAEEEKLKLIGTQEITLEENSLLNEQILKVQYELNIEKIERKDLEDRYSLAIAQLEQANHDPEGVNITSVTQENRVIKSNHQFLVENIDSGRLIHLLHRKNCITDEERFQLFNQPGSFYRNSELVHWMSAITFKQDKYLKVLECFRETEQSFIVDLLEKGGVFVKSKVLTKLAMERKSFSLLNKSSSKKMEVLKEIEAMLIAEINKRREGVPLSSSRSAASDTTDDDIIIAPYCHQEDSGIVIWFWCQSENAQRKLQSLYSSNALVRKCVMIFKQFSTQLIPSGITIYMNDFTNNEKSKTEYKMDPVFIKILETDKADKFQNGISGLAIADTDLFITTFQSKLIEVYELNDFSLKGSWILDPSENPYDLAYCSNNNCLYVMDVVSYQNTPHQIIRVDRSGNILKIWTTGMIYGCLSVSYDCNVLMAEYEGDKIIEYAPDGQIVRRITLSTSAGFSHPRYAIKMTDDRYLMSHGDGEDPLHRVCVVDSSGNIRTSFGGLRGSNSDCLNVPIYLATDPDGSIFVVDRDNCRVLLLSYDLEFKREIIPRNKEGIHRPERIAFDHVNGRLLLVNKDSFWEDGRVFVFKIT